MSDEAVAGEQRHLFALEDAAPRKTRDSTDLSQRVSEVRTAARRVKDTTGGAEATVEIESLAAVAGNAEDGPEPAQARESALDDEPEVPDSLSISQFYDRVRRALAAEFREEVWVQGEIRSLHESRGHRYIELADAGTPTGRGIAPQLEVVCWARQWPRIARELAVAGVELEVGRVIRVRGQVSVWDGGSKLRFALTALDIAALLGGIAAARRKLLLALEAEGLLEANRRHVISPVPLRIGLVASAGSEGHRDFVGQLERSDFAFSVQLAPSMVQGPNAPSQLVAALRSLERYEIDLAVIVRGGGARGDLACFDSEEVVRAIAVASFPVWTGIGHTGDRSVADEVAHRACITPSACGESIVNLVAEYWQSIERRVGVLQGLARARLDGAAHHLERERAGLARAAGHRLEFASARLRSSGSVLTRAALRCLVDARGANEHVAQVLRAYDPTRQLERGWSLTRDPSGRVVRSITDVSGGARLSTRVADGEFVSVVQVSDPGEGR